MTKALIVSDIHSEWGGNFTLPVVDGVEFLILAGDIGSYKSHLPFIQQCARDYKVLYVLGNHEFYGHTLEEVRSFWKSVELENFYFLDNSSVVIDDIEFIGSTLWVDFDRENFHCLYNASKEISDFRKIHNRHGDDYVSAQAILAEFKQSYAFIQSAIEQSQASKKVLITHYAISHQSIDSRYLQNHHQFAINHYYASNLDSFIGSSGIDLAVHGHIHTSADYLLGDTRVVCNPLGYPNAQNSNFELKIVDI